MGYYTEIYVNVDLHADTPEDVIAVLRAMCGMEYAKDLGALAGRPNRWRWMFHSGSYYTPNTSCAKLTFDKTSKKWSLLGKGDIKNYEHEIELFFQWISPYVDARDGEFIGYVRGEGALLPQLVVMGQELNTED